MNNHPVVVQRAEILEQPSKNPHFLALPGVCQFHSLPPVEVPTLSVNALGTTSCQHGPPHHFATGPPPSPQQQSVPSRSRRCRPTRRGLSRDATTRFFYPPGDLLSGICVTTIHNLALSFTFLPGTTGLTTFFLSRNDKKILSQKNKRHTIFVNFQHARRTKLF